MEVLFCKWCEKEKKVSTAVALIPLPAGKTAIPICSDCRKIAEGTGFRGCYHLQELTGPCESEDLFLERVNTKHRRLRKTLEYKYPSNSLSHIKGVNVL